jgi:hypothetical protein
MLTLKFALHRETTFPQSLIDDAPSQGAFDGYAEDILTHCDVQVSLADSIAYLKRLGAWDDSELQDLRLNKMRLFWISLLDCQDNDTCYWYMGD